MDTLRRLARCMMPIACLMALALSSPGAAADDREPGADSAAAPPGSPPVAARGKDIFVFLDGTGNTDKSNTNVRRLQQLIAANGNQHGVATYIAGVGSVHNPLFGKAWGVGMETRVLAGYTFIARQYGEGDRIFIFGFSRGAHEARDLAGLIAYAGLPPPDPSDRAMERRGNAILEMVKDQSDDADADAWRAWQPADGPLLAGKISARLGLSMRPAEVSFLGVWDTVPGSFFKTFDSCREKPDRMPGDRYKSGSYPPIRHIAHAVSLDEKRSRFHPLLVCPPLNAELTKVEQIWFPGAHADVGGGYDDDDGLSNISLQWMIDRLIPYEVFRTPPAALRQNPAGLAHWSVGDSPANHLSTCEDRRQSPEDQASPAVALRTALPALPLRAFRTTRQMPYPVSCRDLGPQAAK